MRAAKASSRSSIWSLVMSTSLLIVPMHSCPPKMHLSKHRPLNNNNKNTHTCSPVCKIYWMLVVDCCGCCCCCSDTELRVGALWAVCFRQLRRVVFCCISFTVVCALCYIWVQLKRNRVRQRERESECEHRGQWNQESVHDIITSYMRNRNKTRVYTKHHQQTTRELRPRCANARPCNTQPQHTHTQSHRRASITRYILLCILVPVYGVTRLLYKNRRRRRSEWECIKLLLWSF